jgi:stress-induced morphogen
MPMAAADIERMIKEGIPDAMVEIKDLAGDGDHYAATVISAAFKGLPKVRQHQMVYAALKGNMGGVLHALALTTGTP